VTTTYIPLMSSSDMAAHQEPFTRVAPVLSAALLLGAGAGFVLASVLTITRAAHIASGAWWTAVVQTHGHIQLFGWAGPFVLGVALHFLPRLRGAPLAHATLVGWLLAALVASILLRLICQPLIAIQGAGLWRACLITSGLLECLGVGTAIFLLLATSRRAGPLTQRAALWSILPLEATVFSSLALASVVNLVNVVRAALDPLGTIPAAGDDLNVTLGLLGFLVPMALAMSARSLPMYSGLDAFPTRVLWPTAFVYLAGLVMALIGTGAGDYPGEWSAMLNGVGLAIIGGVLMFYVATFVRLMLTRGRLPRRVTDLAPQPAAAARRYQHQVRAERSAFGPFVALVASAYLWAMLGGVLLLTEGIAQAIGGTPPVNPDAARHSLTIGFIALLICGVAPRMLPGFSGGRIRSPRYVRATLWLGNAAALLRVGSLLAAPLFAALGTTGSLLDQVAFGLSGPLGLALAICLGINLWPALWPRQAAPI
jgi:uncharacterized protein involved in response to NO